MELHTLTDAEILDLGLTSSYKNGVVPVRFRFLDQAAFDALPQDIVISDMYRSPLGSLKALATQAGSQWPGYSAHNYGLAVDLAIRETMDLHKFRKKVELDEYMATAGFYCHRLDHQMAFEAWHYNFLGEDVPKGVRSSDEVEEFIRFLYEPEWRALEDIKTRQAALKTIGLYDGEIDGKNGPLTQAGTRVFKRAWAYKPGVNFLRVLWAVAEAKLDGRSA